ncbi:MAG TPA: formate--tetrahydrofolate ligase [Thermomicrobiaceae bacterium]|nr:formate--tetrahydrofolate ligase [Thermomicrobiaceae bacterium]
MLTDTEIAASVEPKPITEIAADLGLSPDEIEQYGRYKAKINLDVRKRLAGRPNGKYVVVTAITPTPLGEGKTTVTVGLGEGLSYIGKKSIVAIRQASLGPVFGIKGGAAGGGYAQVIPMTDLNLHLTGDAHAVTAAHNLLSAFIDNSLYQGNPLKIDPLTITWRRVLDVNDRAIRQIVIGLGEGNGVPRETGFDITAASEVMAILALATSYKDLRQRLGRIVVALNTDREPVTAEDIGAAGAMAALMTDALKPNLLQTLEHTPAIVHAGPFGNIAHGNSSVIADLIGLKLGDILVTEAGFGADLGAEKFFDIKCRVSGLVPDAAVVVATVRGLKAHSGRYKVVAGRPLPKELLEEDLDALQAGLPNLEKQIENVRLFGVPAVVAVNQFPTDTPAEIDMVRQCALRAGALEAVPANVFSEGGKGAAELAEAVMRATERPKAFKFLYQLNEPIASKIEAIATKLYGAGQVEYLPTAERSIRQFTRLGYGDLPVCMAKTHLSLSANPKLLGRPTKFPVMVREVRLSAGAGFVYPLLGEMRTMPGLGSKPGGLNVDIDEEGRIHGLF